jgi:hypothetical protein
MVPQLSPDELRADSKTLWYEFEQLLGAADRLRTEAYPVGDNIIHNALVESLALHCRQISCFFFAHRREFPKLQQDDIGAEYYVRAWPQLSPEPSARTRRGKGTG